MKLENYLTRQEEELERLLEEADRINDKTNEVIGRIWNKIDEKETHLTAILWAIARLSGNGGPKKVKLGIWNEIGDKTGKVGKIYGEICYSFPVREEVDGRPINDWATEKFRKEAEDIGMSREHISHVVFITSPKLQ